MPLYSDSGFSLGEEFLLRSARYDSSSLVLILHSPGDSSPFKSRGARLAEALGGRYVGRSRGYHLSVRSAELWKSLFLKGWKASWMFSSGQKAYFSHDALKDDSGLPIEYSRSQAAKLVGYIGIRQEVEESTLVDPYPQLFTLTHVGLTVDKVLWLLSSKGVKLEAVFAVLPGTPEYYITGVSTHTTTQRHWRVSDRIIGHLRQGGFINDVRVPSFPCSVSVSFTSKGRSRSRKLKADQERFYQDG